MNSLDVVLLFALVALVACLLVLAMVEASLLHVRRSAVAADAAAGDRGSQRLLALLDDLPRVINAVLLAVLLLQVSSTAIAGVLAQRWFGGVGITFATVAVTLVLFVYGEAIPKTIAIANPGHYAQRFSRLVRMLDAALSPIVSGLVRFARWQSPGHGTAEPYSVVSEDELLQLTGEAAAAGRIDPTDAELIEKSFTLGDLIVEEILIPISDVVSVPTTAPVETALQTAIAAGHRRLIVHDRSPDCIVGFVRLRDLAHASTVGDDAVTGESVRKALSVDTSALVIEVLREMQRTRCHIAIARGADGNAAGILTVEDIVEELLGRIDEPDPS